MGRLNGLVAVIVMEGEGEDVGAEQRGRRVCETVTSESVLEQGLLVRRRTGIPVLIRNVPSHTKTLFWWLRDFVSCSTAPGWNQRPWPQWEPLTITRGTSLRSSPVCPAYFLSPLTRMACREPPHTPPSPHCTEPHCAQSPPYTPTPTPPLPPFSNFKAANNNNKERR